MDDTSEKTSFLYIGVQWVTKMLGYEFEIIYKKGKQNVVADALSRKEEDVEAFLRVISIIQPNWKTLQGKKRS